MVREEDSITDKDHGRRVKREAERDAKRYRWLRDKHVQSDWGDGSITFRWQVPLQGGGSLEGSMKLYRDSLDAAIDAALAPAAKGIER